MLEGLYIVDVCESTGAVQDLTPGEYQDILFSEDSGAQPMGILHAKTPTTFAQRMRSLADGLPQPRKGMNTWAFLCFVLRLWTSAPRVFHVSQNFYRLASQATCWADCEGDFERVDGREDNDYNTRDPDSGPDDFDEDERECPTWSHIDVDCESFDACQERLQRHQAAIRAIQDGWCRTRAEWLAAARPNIEP